MCAGAATLIAVLAQCATARAESSCPATNQSEASAISIARAYWAGRLDALIVVHTFETAHRIGTVETTRQMQIARETMQAQLCASAIGAALHYDAAIAAATGMPNPAKALFDTTEAAYTRALPEKSMKAYYVARMLTLLQYYAITATQPQSHVSPSQASEQYHTNRHRLNDFIYALDGNVSIPGEPQSPAEIRSACEKAMADLRRDLLIRALPFGG